MALNILNLTYVPRWSIVPLHRGQSVAEHSWRVAVLVDKLCRELGYDGTFKLEAVYYAVFHDADEAQTGDIPHPVKQRLGMNEVPEDEMDALLKVADYLEAQLWIAAWAARVRQEPVYNYLAKEINKVIDTHVRLGERELWRTAVAKVRGECYGW